MGNILNDRLIEPSASRRALLLGVATLALSPSSALIAPERVPTLLVRGDAALPAGASLAWRVVRDVAEVGAAAGFERRALGFAVATGLFGALLLTDEATGSAYRLDPGDASFVREGTMQRRESLGEGATTYLRIGLVEATAVNDAGGDRLVFAGPAFSAPAGPVSLVLQRVVLDEGELSFVTPGAAPTLVLVEQGELNIEQGEAAPLERLQTVVGSDTSYAVRSLPRGTTLLSVQDATWVLIAKLL